MVTNAVTSGSDNRKKQVWMLLEVVKDPEIPVLSVIDLGMARDVKVHDDEVEVVITPTYSGCPAMDTIEHDILAVLRKSGFPKAKVTTVLSPAWTTEWMTESGREKLRSFGIAPPEKPTADKRDLFGSRSRIRCPLCGSDDTKLVSEFGSTACKALYKCRSCLEPFDYFKCM